MGVDADDPPVDRHRMHDEDGVLAEQPLQLGAQPPEPARLDLDDLAPGPRDVDHAAAACGLELVPRLGIEVLQGRVERPLGKLSDAQLSARGA